jgi:hypothetical protein
LSHSRRSMDAIFSNVSGFTPYNRLHCLFGFFRLLLRSHALVYCFLGFPNKSSNLYYV